MMRRSEVTGLRKFHPQPYTPTFTITIYGNRLCLQRCDRRGQKATLRFVMRKLFENNLKVIYLKSSKWKISVGSLNGYSFCITTTKIIQSDFGDTLSLIPEIRWIDEGTEQRLARATSLRYIGLNTPQDGAISVYLVYVMDEFTTDGYFGKPHPKK